MHDQARGSSRTYFDAAAMLASCIVAVTQAWDTAVAEHGAAPLAGSAGFFDQHDFADVTNTPHQMTSLPMALATLTCSSVIQIARSIAALYDVADRWALTLGHLPGVRSVLEGAGQVRWLILGDSDIDSSAAVTVPEMLDHSEQRVTRAVLLWAKCLQEGVRDAAAQSDGDGITSYTNALLQWESTVRPVLPSVEIQRKKDGRRHFDTWSADDVKVPSYTQAANKGLALALWSEGGSSSADEQFALYPWLSAATHHRLYPLMSTLEPGTHGGRDVQIVAPHPAETVGAGYIAASALYMTARLAFSYVGWPATNLLGVEDSLREAHRLLCELG